MSTIQISLCAGQRIYLNGAVIRADRKVTLELMNDATFLLEGHILQARQIAKPLHAFHQDGDRERRRWPTRALADEDELLGRGCIDLAQLLS